MNQKCTISDVSSSLTQLVHWSKSLDPEVQAYSTRVWVMVLAGKISLGFRRPAQSPWLDLRKLIKLRWLGPKLLVPPMLGV